MLFFFYFLANLVDSCSTKDKIKCGALAAGCGAACVCTIPACECCPLCLACIVAMGADCCECLFMGWSGCSDKLTMARIKNQSVNFLKNNLTGSDPIGSCYAAGQLYSCGKFLDGQECCGGRWHGCTNPHGCRPCGCPHI